MKINLGQIAEGWRNNLFPPEKKKELIKIIAEERMKICNACEFISTKHSTPLRPDVHCTVCSCTLSAKTKALSTACPKDKWQAITEEE